MNETVESHIARREKMLGRIRVLLVEKLRVPREPDEIDPDTPLFGVGLALDSIDAVDLLVYLGSDFGVDIPSDEVGRTTLRTVNSLVDLALDVQEGQGAST
jgi:acyl carrier protein